MNAFIRTVRRSPSLARVQNVGLEWINPHARDSSFETGIEGVSDGTTINDQSKRLNIHIRKD